MFYWKRIFATIFVPLFFAGIGVAAWRFSRDSIQHQPQYHLDADQIRISPAPDWISQDFVKKVLDASGLTDRSSLFDDSLSKKLSQAFAADPWVESVERVEIRYPAGADIRLTYRKPVAFVELPSQELLPIDRNGILLSTYYFAGLTPEDRSVYPRIQGLKSFPQGEVGFSWGDPLVHDTARFIDSLSDIFVKTKLKKVRPVTEKTATGNRCKYQLSTDKGATVLWGTFEPDQAIIETKRKRLLDILDMYKSLDNVPDNFLPLDLSVE